uniref:Ribosome-recycling factor n=1 Tax=Anthurium amnicola TaxID=1678845 RepID=A0A1D1XED6_9ARAE
MPLKSITMMLCRSKMLRPTGYVGCRRWLSLQSCRQYEHPEEEEELLPAEWYKAAYPKLIKLACALKNVDQIDEKLINVGDGLAITDDHVITGMHMFKSLARAFIGSPSMQEALKNTAASASPGSPATDSCFVAGREREPMTLNSLTTVCNLLNISAQQRKSVRLSVCPQVTKHHIWRGALEEVLKNLGSELRTLRARSPAMHMGEQIASSCIRFLADTTGPSQQETPLWMQLAPEKKADKPVQMRKWAEVLEMFGDLTRWLDKEEKLAGPLSKIEVMKEGLYQIKDLLVEREIGYKEARRQDCLVQKLLSKNLGHSSKCLFTLLLYYLYGSVGDLEVDACGFYACNRAGGSNRLCAGKFLTSDDQRMVQSNLKQLDRTLGVFKFVWETAGMKGVLEMQGHIWCVGAEESCLMYRGNRFFVHNFRL